MTWKPPLTKAMKHWIPIEACDGRHEIVQEKVKSDQGKSEATIETVQARMGVELNAGQEEIMEVEGHSEGQASKNEGFTASGNTYFFYAFRPH
jgi:hypothetical protein